jgi:SAM-dependent methyltransferase
MRKVSNFDNNALLIIRESVTSLIKEASIYDKIGLKVLDIAPQMHKGAKEYFKFSKIDTLDICPDTMSTFTADICQNNSNLILDNYYDIIICTEVLEHTFNPISACNEIFRILKKGGICYASTPFNFRIHGPLPDCWRFTEYGLKSLFSSFDNVIIRSIEDVDRFLMPIHYQTIATK